MSKIVWVASYPKSGNTWMRAFLINYLRNLTVPVDINDLKEVPNASARVLFDRLLGVHSRNLTEDEIDRYRASAYNLYAQLAEETLSFLKVHDAYTYIQDGEAIFPPDCTYGAIYIVRNPLDIVLSMTHHFNISTDKAIDFLNSDNFMLGVKIDDSWWQVKQVKQRLMSWSHNVLSWTEISSIPIHIIRYEDMLANPEDNFAGVVRFLGWNKDAERLQRAIKSSDFKQLQSQESQNSFRERARPTQVFFRQGKANAWRDKLSCAQVERIVHNHGETMARFGYLEEIERGENGTQD